ncbi:sugar transferase [Sphingomonas sp. RB3P16]|uniref:sugar transferase n=1 Tax=Parasphingomonas frigoris TaxID=3096163 RepID=UPI002FC8346D
MTKSKRRPIVIQEARRAPTSKETVLLSRASAIRALDLTVALAALAFLFPLLVLVAILVFAFDPGPIFFAQRRIGQHGVHFRCFKFRSMATNAEERLQHVLQTDLAAREEWQRDHKLKRDPRITGIGGFLRKSSMDELPQLINVLKGEMSLVGPRPIVDAEVSRYGRYFAHYCLTKPGITGLWQISGRNNVSYRRRVAFDVAYSRSVSFKLNLKILAYTIPSVLLAKGSY